MQTQNTSFHVLYVYESDNRHTFIRILNRLNQLTFSQINDCSIHPLQIHICLLGLIGTYVYFKRTFSSKSSRISSTIMKHCYLFSRVNHVIGIFQSHNRRTLVKNLNTDPLCPNKIIAAQFWKTGF